MDSINKNIIYSNKNNFKFNFIKKKSQMNTSSDQNRRIKKAIKNIFQNRDCLPIVRLSLAKKNLLY